MFSYFNFHGNRYECFTFNKTKTFPRSAPCVLIPRWRCGPARTLQVWKCPSCPDEVGAPACSSGGGRSKPRWSCPAATPLGRRTHQTDSSLRWLRPDHCCSIVDGISHAGCKEKNDKIQQCLISGGKNRSDCIEVYDKMTLLLTWCITSDNIVNMTSWCELTHTRELGPMSQGKNLTKRQCEPSLWDKAQLFRTIWNEVNQVPNNVKLHVI